jgi:ribosomal-protein-alanine N-acetyltransferase
MSLLRRATVDDVPALALLDQHLFPENAMGECLLEGELRAGWGLVLGEPLSGYVLVREEGTLVDITRLGVHPAREGQGMGGRLLDAVLAAVLVRRGRAMLTVKKKDNGRAIQIYRRRGFAIVAELQDAWLMHREAR